VWVAVSDDLREPTVEELLARVPERYELIATHSKLKGRRWCAGWWADDEQAAEGYADTREGAIRAATLQLLGEAPEPGPALQGDGWQILPGEGTPGLTAREYAAEYLQGRVLVTDYEECRRRP
jgi:hypothetical protein